MSLVRLTVADAEVLTRPGKRSAQIVSTRNAPRARMTITRVVLEPGAVSPPHRHEAAEQTWIVEQGAARLMMGDDGSARLGAGDVVVIPPGEIHGVENTGDVDFVYLAAATPPEDMARFYDGHPRRDEPAHG